MDDIIVIILTLVVAVIGILNQKKKKAAKQEPEVEGTNQPSGFWDMIMDTGQVQENMSPDDDLEQVIGEREKPVEKPKYKFSASTEGRSDIKDEMKTLVKKKKRATIDGEKFSLRKAVIYNEIMNRKYL